MSPSGTMVALPVRSRLPEQPRRPCLLARQVKRLGLPAARGPHWCDGFCADLRGQLDWLTGPGDPTADGDS